MNNKYRLLFLALFIFILVIFWLHPLSFLGGFLKPVSVFSQIVTGAKLKSTDGRTNILLLGLDRREGDAGRTDSILFLSLDFREKSAVALSLPRDLWVPPLRAKINAAYAYGGLTKTTEMTGRILGVPIHYYASIDFGGFEKAVDLLGGLELTVARTFDDYYYPIPGRENDTCGTPSPTPGGAEASPSSEKDYACRYDHLHFSAGLQRMDGKMALKFVRSRHAEGAEGSDLARAGRQQLVALAVLRRAISLDFILNPGRIQELLSAFSQSVETNLGVVEIEKFFNLGREIKPAQVRTVVLGDNYLYSPVDSGPYDYQWVLVPKAGDFSEIQAYIQRLLFGAGEIEKPVE